MIYHATYGKGKNENGKKLKHTLRYHAPYNMGMLMCIDTVHEKESTENVLQSKKIIVFIPRSKILPCFNNREQRLFKINIRHEKVAFILQIA